MGIYGFNEPMIGYFFSHWMKWRFSMGFRCDFCPWWFDPIWEDWEDDFFGTSTGDLAKHWLMRVDWVSFINGYDIISRYIFI